MSTQDALEIAAIIAQEAKAIWESADAIPVEPARVEGDETSCRLWLESGVLEVIAHDAKPMIALLFDSGTQCKLDVSRAIALVQVLRHMAEAIGHRPLYSPAL